MSSARSFFLMQIKVIFIRMVSHLARFETEAQGNSEMAYLFFSSLRLNRSLQLFWALANLCRLWGSGHNFIRSAMLQIHIRFEIIVHEVLMVRHWIKQSSLDRFHRKRQATAENNCGEEGKCWESEPKTTEATEELRSQKRYEKKEETRGQNIWTGVEENICHDFLP